MKTLKLILDIPLVEQQQDEPAECEPLRDDQTLGTASITIHDRNATLRLRVSIYTPSAQKRHSGENPEE